MVSIETHAIDEWPPGMIDACRRHFSWDRRNDKYVVPAQELFMLMDAARLGALNHPGSDVAEKFCDTFGFERPKID